MSPLSLGILHSIITSGLLFPPATVVSTQEHDKETILGIWDARIDAPNGVLQGELKFEKTRDGLSAVLTNKIGQITLNRVRFRHPYLSMEILIGDLRLRLMGVLQNRQFRGKWELDAMEIEGSWTAKRGKD